ncbi:MAG: tetratricopeptide repeat protein [Terriglobales bacterium]
MAVLICLGFAVPAFSAEAQWIEIRSPHFSVVTDAGDKRGRDAAARFEQMRDVFASLLNQAKVNTPIPLQIVAFRSNKELRQFAPIFRGKATEISGLFLGGTDRCFILLDMSAENPWQVVFHEYAHQLMNGTLSMQLDPWFEEGFAEYFRGITVDGKEADVGRVPDDEYAVLANNSWMKIADLLRVQQHTKIYNESGDRRTVFYAESGILVHYIYDNALLPKVAVYFDLTRNQHVPVEKAVQQAFGMSATQFDTELYGYVKDNRFRYYKLAAPPGIDGKRYTSAPLSTTDARVVLADIHLHSSDYQKVARDEFEAVLQTDPTNAGALRGLGYSYLIQRDFAKAAEYFHKSAQLNSNDPRVLYYSALLSQMEGSTAGNDTGRLESMQNELERSIKLDPDFPDAYGLLAFTYMSQGKLDQAMPVLRKAIELSPRNEQYRINLAHLYLRSNKIPEATAILRDLQTSSDPKIAGQSTAELAQMQKYIDRTRAAQETPRANHEPESSPGPENPKSEEGKQEIASSPDAAVPAKETAASTGRSPIFHTGTSLVLVDVLTQDSKTGLPLNELKKEDFRVLDNGHPVDIVTFDSGAHYGTRPIAVWFAMICNQKHWDEEGSGFMRGKAGLLRPALDHLDKRDTVGVAHWCDNGEEAIDLVPTTDRDAPMAMIEEVQHRDPTEVGNRTGELSIQRMLRLILANAHTTKPEPLPVIVFLYGDHSGLPYNEIESVADDLLETSAFVYGINDGAISPNALPHNTLDEQNYVAHYLSVATAGQFFSVKPAMFATALDDILVQVHFRYQVGFKPAAVDGKRHELTVALADEIKVQHKSVRLLHRSEYIPTAK